MGVRGLFEYIDEWKDNWQEFIREPDNSEEMKEIREQTRKGMPLGGPDFVKKLEIKLKRFLILKPKGRPKKQERQRK